jgi:hypothetical protein
MATGTVSVSALTGETEEDWCLGKLYLTASAKVPTKEHIIEEAEVGVNELPFRVLSSV